MLEKLANRPIPLPLISRIPESQPQSHNLPQKYLKYVLHLAIWFHDIVYDPIKGEPHNENASIAAWENFVQQAEPRMFSFTPWKVK
jgi:hypothetical protein